MPTRAELIRQATDTARQQWEGYLVSQERRIWDVFSNSFEKVAGQIAKYESKGIEAPARLKAVYQDIKGEMAYMRTQMRSAIVSGMKGSVDYGIEGGVSAMRAGFGGSGAFKAEIGTAFFGKDGELRRFDPKVETYANSQWAKINGQAMDAIMRFQPSGITLSDRVWDISWETEKAIRNKVAQAVLTGQSPANLSREIRKHLEMPETFRGGAFDQYKSGVGVYRSAYKNAMRLARTELARAHSEGTLRYMNSKTWIDGVYWRVGGTNPCEDCVALDGVFFPKEDEPPTQPLHPHCICYLELHYKEDSVEEKPQAKE